MPGQVRVLTGPLDVVRHLEVSIGGIFEHLRLPSITTITELKDGSIQNSMDPIPHTMITSYDQAINVAIRLISIIADVDGLTGGFPVVKTSSFASTWTVGTMAQLWRIMGLNEAHFRPDNARLAILEIFLKSLRSYVVRYSEARFDLACAARSSQLLSQVLASSLNIQHLVLLPPFEKLCCLSLLDFAHAGRLWKGSGRILNECLIPSLLHIKDDTSRLRTFGQDLQVNRLKPFIKRKPMLTFTYSELYAWLSSFRTKTMLWVRRVFRRNNSHPSRTRISCRLHMGIFATQNQMLRPIVLRGLRNAFAVPEGVMLSTRPTSCLIMRQRYLIYSESITRQR